MNYADFYDIATYGNEMWKGSFNKKEIACNAYDYYADFQWSKENEMVARTIQELAKLLAEDESEQCKDWLYTMATELELLDMDYWDYEETDTDIVELFFNDNRSK